MSEFNFNERLIIMKTLLSHLNYYSTVKEYTTSIEETKTNKNTGKITLYTFGVIFE